METDREVHDMETEVRDKHILQVKEGDHRSVFEVVVNLLTTFAHLSFPLETRILTVST